MLIGGQWRRIAKHKSPPQRPSLVPGHRGPAQTLGVHAALARGTITFPLVHDINRARYSA